jgi:tetraacyldisaccharide 4'-kinase
VTEEKRWEHRLWTRRGQGALAGAAARAPLLLLAGLYGLGVQTRLAAYRLGLLPRIRPAAKVVAVGNLTVGGTGKTPLTAWIARRLLEAGRRPAVLTRGYRGRAGAGPLLVSGGAGPLVTVAEAGDEAFFLAHRLHGVPVIAGRDRGRSAEMAMRDFNATDLVLDDGYQHLALERDLDLLLVEAERDLDREYLLPRGPLREPLAAAGRAHALILTGAVAPDPPRPPWMDRYCPAAPLFAMRYRTLGLVGLAGGIRPLRAPSFAFCGLGRPEGFFQSLAAAGVPVAGKEIFGDHHLYTPKEVLRLAEAARQAGAERLVTTEKDAMKIGRDWTRFDLAVLRVEPDFFGREDEFFEFIVRRLGPEGNAA